MLTDSFHGSGVPRIRKLFRSFIVTGSHSHRNKLLKHIPVNRRRDVVCAGGNQGLYPRLLSEIFENVYTFEPDPLSFHCLAANCQKSNIVKIQAALGRERGLVQMQCMSPAEHRYESGAAGWEYSHAQAR